MLLGLRIDHVLHAIVGTPTVDGLYSPQRTLAGLEQPLMALCEVGYCDSLLPLLDSVGVVPDEWHFVGEKLEGIVSQTVVHKEHYATCVPHLKNLIHGLLDLYEMLRQCQDEQALHFHVFKDWPRF